MKGYTKNAEQGIALAAVLLLLMLLSAMAVGLVFLSNTETLINGNLRQEQLAIFAARAGVEEARDRMMASNANSIFAQLPASAPAVSGGILYILNEGSQAGTVQPWQSGNAYMDDELCHDGYSLPGLQAQSTVAPGIRCSGPPTGNSWYTTVTSTTPWAGTSAALSYKWVRVAMKLNGSVQNYMVNATASATTPVCWNGTTEVILAAANCGAMAPSMNPVYLLTALAVSSTGARKMMQSEVALNPSQPLPYGLFATGTGCGAVTLSGGSTTDGFTTANGGTYATTVDPTGGDIGSNGNVTLTGKPTTVGGSIGMPTNPPVEGSCPGAGYTSTGGSGMVANPANQLMTNNPPTIVIPTPPLPNPLPPTNNVQYSKGASLVPGSYGNISVSGGSTLTLAPGTYDLNSISLSGGSTLVISPPGQIVLNIAGQGATNAIDFSGGSVSNPSGIANDVQVNYAGSGNVNLSGNSSTYMVVDAPNAAVKFSGGSDFYGAVVGNTITDSGGTKFHHDKTLSFTPQSNGYLNLISMRDVTY